MPKAVKVALVFRSSLKRAVSVGIGAGIAALDVIDAELVQQVDHRQLVIERKINAGRLLAIAQRGVEEGDVFAGHDILLLPSPLEGEGVARAARDG